MFRRREPQVIVIEVTKQPTERRTVLPSMNYTPLATRDPRALVVANLLLNAPTGEDGAEVPEDLRKWARNLLGDPDVR